MRRVVRVRLPGRVCVVVIMCVHMVVRVDMCMFVVVAVRVLVAVNLFFMAAAPFL